MWKVARETSRPRPNWREFTKRRSEKLLGRSTIPATEGNRRGGFQRDFPLENIYLSGRRENPVV
jgi:hypothetical protein